MTFLRRTHLRHIFLVVFTAGVVPYSAAMEDATIATSAAPRGAAVQPSAPVDAAAYGLSTAQQYRTSPYGSLLGDTGGGSPLTEPVLVVPGQPMDPQVLGQIVEDLSVMSRIIEKNALAEYYYTLGGFGEMTAYNAYRISVWNGTGPATLFPSVGRAKPMYVGGYGAVFFIQVNHPLMPPPEAPREEPANQQRDPVWAEAKRSVLEPQAWPVLRQEEGEPVEPYNREQVDTLRNALITTLKHATNIRLLEASEWITIVVQGVAPAPQAPQISSPGPMVLPTTATPTRRTMLTLRATKADIDQHAKGQLNQQQFEQRLQIVTY